MSKADTQDEIDRLRREWTEMWDDDSQEEYATWLDQLAKQRMEDDD